MEVKSFVPPNQQRECVYWRNLEKKGKVISVRPGENRLEPANSSYVRQILEGNDYIAVEYSEVESVISFLNKEVLESREQFQVPLNDSVEYILLFNGRVLAYLRGTDTEEDEDEDDDDDSEVFICLDGVVLLYDNILDQELLDIAAWLQRAFSF